VVFDLSEWHKPGKVGMDREIAATMMVKVINDLMIAQKTMQPRRTCLVVIDETHLWVPQSRTPGGMSKATADEIYNAVMGLATTGRKLGLMPLFAAQRIATVHNDVIGSVETRIFGKADLDNDIRRYREYFDDDVVTDEQIRSFNPGEMVVCTSGKRVLVQFYQRDSRHTSATPSVTQDLNKFAQRLPPEMLAALAHSAEAEQSSERQLDQQPIQAPPSRPDRQRRPTAELPEILRVAYNALAPGMTYRDLGAALGYSDREARMIWQELRKRGLLRASACAEAIEEQATNHPAAAGRPQLYEVPRQDAKDERWRLVPASDLAKGFALWQAGYDSVRKLEDGAKAAEYGWSNGYCRDVREALINHKLIQGQKKEAGVL
jgi:hypothetical protein